MNPAGLSHLWHHLLGYLGHPQHGPARVLIIGTGIVALAAVASPRIWPVSRTIVTMAHEGGHALMALLTGRRLSGVRVLRTTAGVTVSAGRPDGPGAVLTMAAGYLAPPVLGLGATALAATGHLAGLLILSLVALAGLALAMRNAYGMLAAAAASAVVAVVLWSGSALAEAVLGYTMSWFLLIGGVRPVLELQRTRRHRPGARTDADQLAAMTGIPGLLWVAMFGLVAVAAFALSAVWLGRA
ncbi:MAG: M50 family metallopeptidase [Streptosporangiaceae bacterium]